MDNAKRHRLYQLHCELAAIEEEKSKAWREAQKRKWFEQGLADVISKRVLGTGAGKSRDSLANLIAQVGKAMMAAMDGLPGCPSQKAIDGMIFRMLLAETEGECSEVIRAVFEERGFKMELEETDL